MKTRIFAVLSGIPGSPFYLFLGYNLFSFIASECPKRSGVA